MKIADRQDPTGVRGHMPLRPVPKEPMEVRVTKLFGAKYFQIILEAPSGLEKITSTAQTASFYFNGDYSVVAVIQTFNGVPFLQGTFQQRIDQILRKRDRERMGSYIAPLVTEENFPVEANTVESFQGHILTFQKRVSFDYVKSFLAKNKIWLRFGLFDELISFGAMFPEIQGTVRINALGSSVNILQKVNGETESVEISPVLSQGQVFQGSQRRMLTTTPVNRQYLPSDSFLCASKWPNADRR